MRRKRSPNGSCDLRWQRGELGGQGCNGVLNVRLCGQLLTKCDIHRVKLGRQGCNGVLNVRHGGQLPTKCNIHCRRVKFIEV
jgi:hypothetical protein